MSDSNAEKNKAIVLKAFDTLFNKRDFRAAERFWSCNYVQHNATIPLGRDGLFTLVKDAPRSLKYEPGEIFAEDDYVIVHGRFSNLGLPLNWIGTDVVRLKAGKLVVRLEDGVLVEHWTVVQGEATRQQSKGRYTMNTLRIESICNSEW